MLSNMIMPTRIKKYFCPFNKPKAAPVFSR